MSELKKEFEEIVEKYEQKIKVLDTELSEGHFHTFLNLNKEYKCFIHDLANLFRKHDYIISDEMYDYFYKTNCKKYNLLFEYSEYLHGSGQLPGAFLEEAISDLMFYGIDELFFMEKENNFFNKKITEIYSLSLIDTILETKECYNGKIGYKYNDITISESYLRAAEEILREYGDNVIDKASNYYEKSLTFLKKASASSWFESWIYYTYYIKLNKLLSSYKKAINEYGIKNGIDIDKELFECNYSNYRQAQSHVKCAMVNQIKNLVNQKDYKEAIRLAKENIDICEERVKNYLSIGVKLSLQQAYEYLLSIPTLSEQEIVSFTKRLNMLKESMTHKDYFVKDGDKEYPISPM